MTPANPSLTSQLLGQGEPTVAVLTGREFEKLATVARLSERGSFAIALYSTVASRQLLVADLERRVAPLPLVEYSLNAQQPDPAHYLAQLTPAQRRERAVICLYGLESGWPDSAKWLDRQRDQLAANPHTLIVWILKETRGKLMHEAPNFYSRHSGVFNLCLPVGESPSPSWQRTIEREPTAYYESVADWEAQERLYQALLVAYEANSQVRAKARSDLYRKLAALYAARSMFPEARNYYQRAYALLEPEAAKGDEADLLYQIGRMRYYAAEHENALLAYQQALTLFRQVGARLGEANVLKAIGDVQNFRKEMDAALSSYQQALTLFRQVGDRLGEANVLQAIGFFLLDQGDGENGLKILDHAVQLFQQIDERVGQANIYWGLGIRLAQNGALEQAESLIAQAVFLGNQFAPGHPQTLQMEAVLTQIRSHLKPKGKEAWY